jgi:hypothetical protein
VVQEPGAEQEHDERAHHEREDVAARELEIGHVLDPGDENVTCL